MQGILQRKCACGNHTVAGGECGECANKKNVLQRKLTIGASNDPLEQEADRVAEQVMAISAHSVVSGTPRIQRYIGQASEGENTAPASVDRVLTSSGRPLEPALQQDMEQRFGNDFSQVRVHTGGVAAQSARDVNAHAYTVGNNVVFGAGQFAPGTQEGRRLIAHELTHIIQQNVLATNVIQRVFNEEDMESDTVTESTDTLDTDSAEKMDKQGGRGSCRAERNFSFTIRNFREFEFTVPAGCSARVTFTALWVPVGLPGIPDYVDCCTGADTYEVIRNGGTATNLPVGANVCGDNAQHNPRTGTINTGRGRQRFRVNVDRGDCEGIAMELSVNVQIR
jgi:hypothetical protein